MERWLSDQPLLLDLNASTAVAKNKLTIYTTPKFFINKQTLKLNEMFIIVGIW